MVNNLVFFFFFFFYTTGTKLRNNMIDCLFVVTLLCLHYMIYYFLRRIRRQSLKSGREWMDNIASLQIHPTCVIQLRAHITSVNSSHEAKV